MAATHSTKRRLIHLVPGERFDRLTVIGPAPPTRTGTKRALCRCDCGRETLVCPKHLKSGHTRSCGCSYQGQRKGKLMPKTLALIDAIRQRYAEEGPSLIAKEFGLDARTTIVRAHLLGVRSVNRRKRQGDSFASSRPNLRLRYFDTWTPNMAWMLGYIWADGSIAVRRQTMMLAFLCTESDRVLLERIKAELNTSCQITWRKAYDFLSLDGSERIYTSKPAVSLHIGSKILVTSLMEKHGLEPRKSFKNLPFPHVPEEYLPHFVRGHFDGDGCVYIRSNRPNTGAVCLLGTPLFLQGMQERVVSAALVADKKPAAQNGGKLLRVMWESVSDIANLHRWLYPPGDYLFLPRKREKMSRLVEIQKSVKPKERRG